MAAISRSEAVDQIAAALAKAQAEITGARKTGVNPHLKSKYADLEDSWDAIKEPLSKNGLALYQGGVTLENGQPGLGTLLMHSSGQWLEGVLPLVSKDPTDPQKLGSAMTYMRRYGLKAAVGLYDTDDDGEAASKQKQGQRGDQQQAQRAPEGGTMPPEVVQGYLDRIKMCSDVNVLRGITSTGIKSAREMGDAQAQATILAAGKARKDWLEPPAVTSVTSDGEVV